MNVVKRGVRHNKPQPVLSRVYCLNLKFHDLSIGQQMLLPKLSDP